MAARDRRSPKPMLTTVRAIAWGTLLAAALPAVAQAPAVDPGNVLPPNAAASGPGPIHASPIEAVNDRAEQVAPRPRRPIARLLGNGTALDYGKGGANAIGDTGGLTTGARGSSGAMAGGGGIDLRPGAGAAGRSDARSEPSSDSGPNGTAGSTLPR